MTDPDNTAVASLQTPPGMGGIAVILLQGPAAGRILREVFRPRTTGGDAPGRLQLGHLMDGQTVIDEALVGYTRDGVEINVHGGPVVVRRTLERLAAAGATEADPAAKPPLPFEKAHPRWANPAIGEEMLAVIGQAGSTLVAAAISRQWSAGLSELARNQLAALEAGPSAANAAALRAAADKLAVMQRLLRPAEVVLAGPPNTGKSTLANAIIGRAVSIVHHQAGTTRDWVREPANILGLPIHLTDTAGLWETDHAIDAEAVRRAWQRIEQADLVLLTACDEPIELPQRIHAKAMIHVATKSDTTTPPPHTDLAVSAHTGDGMDELKAAILRQLHLENFDPAEPMAFTQRQANLLHVAADAIQISDNQAARESLCQLLTGEEN
ncbi:MAG: 50S ribosome-binding GTPase [Phycisphaerae bacterium]|nr:50S ribosome-binding GTPase [Phycisphaerae bacterium]